MGSHDYLAGSSTSYSTKQRIGHENYIQEGDIQNDIGLIKIYPGIIFNKNRVWPVFLPEKEPTDPSVWPTMDFAGWGYNTVSSSV